MNRSCVCGSDLLFVNGFTNILFCAGCGKNILFWNGFGWFPVLIFPHYCVACGSFWFHFRLDGVLVCHNGHIVRRQ